jgi:hypothetical protein
VSAQRALLTLPRALCQRADGVLRGAPWAVAADRPAATLCWLALCVVVFGMGYGAVMGSFGCTSLDRLLHPLYAALKVPLLLLVTGALSLPCFFVLYTLAGLRQDFGAVLRALLAAQAALAVILAALAPFTAWWYASSANYGAAVLCNGVMFALGSGGAQLVLRRHYRPLIARHPRHRLLLRAWLGIYIFVGIQMGWVLRPFIGDPDQPVQFFRTESWGNAYVVVARLLWQALTPGGP